MEDNFELMKKTVEAATEPKRIHMHESTRPVDILIVPDGYDIQDMDRYADQPRRLKASQDFSTTSAFCQYINNWKNEDTLLRGDSRTGEFLAVIDYHEDVDEPSWCGHKARLLARQTPEWKLWMEKNRIRMRQREFVHFIQDNIEDVYQPNSSELLKMVADVKTKIGGGRTSSVSNSHERRTSEADYTVESGLPEMIVLSVRPWEHTERYELRVRPFLYHDDDGAQFMLSVINAERVLQTAFDDTAQKIREEIGLEVLV